MTSREALQHAFVLLMAGGSGTRFWPLSRRGRPKQLLPLVGPSPLLRQAYERIRPLVPPGRVLLFTAAALAPAVRRLLPEIPRANILGEPVGRNTAPCIGAAALLARARDPRAVLAVLPSDHVIGDPAAFRSDLRRALRLALREPLLLTLGVRPAFPATGYGYIEAGDPLPADRRFRAVRRFREKPRPALARRYVDSGRFLWNAGIFVWRADAVLASIRDQCPALGGRLDALARRGSRWKHIVRAFPSFPSISIDYAVLEKARNVAVLPVRFPWDDVGAWDALASHHPADGRGNVRIGPGCAVDASGNVLVGGAGGLVAALGVRDLIVVHTPDATLVCRRGRSQEIREVVERLRREGRERFL